jgi:hypothetical protein
MSGNEAVEYEGGRPTPVKKGRPSNSSGRSKGGARLFDPGSILEEIDNEEIVVVENGKRTRMTKAEAEIRQLFAKSRTGDLKSARHIFNLAREAHVQETKGGWDYDLIGLTEAKRRFGRNWRIRIDELNASRGYLNALRDGRGTGPATRRVPSEMNDESQDPPNSGKYKKGQSGNPKGRPKKTTVRLSAAYLFRKVANEQTVAGRGGKKVKMTRWAALTRQLQAMSLNKNTEAARLLQQIRKQFPTNAPAEKYLMVVSDADMKL